MSSSQLSSRAPKLALVQQGDPTRPGVWSGVPAGLMSGLTAAGCEVVPVNAEFRGAGRVAHHLRMSWADQATNRVFATACSAAANRALRAAGPLDGIVMIGSGYSISSPAPVITFEDMTVAQAVRQRGSSYELLGEAAVSRWKERQQRNYERSSACCVASGWAADSLREDYGIAPAKIHVVGLGSNIEVEPVERSWGSARFLFVGVDWERKRGAAVLEAFEAVRRQRPGVTLDLVGSHETVRAEGVRDHGLLALGSEEGQRRYAELLQRSTCLLMPSTFEPFGIAYLDAAVAGIPSVGTTQGGAEEAVGGCGRVVDPDDPEALVRAMSELADADTARELGERARRRRATISWRAVAERVLDALS